MMDSEIRFLRKELLHYASRIFIVLLSFASGSGFYLLLPHNAYAPASDFVYMGTAWAGYALCMIGLWPLMKTPKKSDKY